MQEWMRFEAYGISGYCRPVRAMATVQTPVADAIDEAQPKMHLSCDWLSDVLALGLLIFPLRTYEELRRLNGSLS